MRKIRIGVVGVGHLGSIHARIYKEIQDCSLVCICDIDREHLDKISSELEVLGLTDYRQLLGKVDAVSIAVPTRLHFEVAQYFLKNHIHTLIEKPFTVSLKEADALIRLAKKNDCILQVGHVERFNSAFSAIKDLIKEPKFIECHRLSPFLKRSLDVGVVLDLMIHDIDIVLGLVNSPLKKIEAVGVGVLTPYEDIANARISFKNGCVCNLTASRISDESMRKIRIFLKDAYISLDYRNETAYIYRKTPCGISKDPLPIEKEEPLKKELSSFVECILKDKVPVVSGEVARQALSLALKITHKIWKTLKRFS